MHTFTIGSKNNCEGVCACICMEAMEVLDDHAIAIVICVHPDSGDAVIRIGPAIRVCHLGMVGDHLLHALLW